MPSVRITPVPLFSDNYAYVIADSVHRTCLLVDPAVAGPCLAAAAASGCELVGVLTTHHHADHSGGNADVAAAAPGVAVLGGASEEGRIPAATRLVGHGEALALGGMALTALHTPCHTRGHVCYLLPGEGGGEGAGGEPPSVFTGDTLFGGGCGRFFVGGAAQMAASLAQLAALPPDTRVYFGHEYTVANLQFAAAAEPDNAAVAARLEAARACRARGEPPTPSTIRLELETNVFMRCAHRSVWAGLFPELPEGAPPPEPVEVLARLREAKNNFVAP